jgi:hypothetical protein
MVLKSRQNLSLILKKRDIFIKLFVEQYVFRLFWQIFTFSQNERRNYSFVKISVNYLWDHFREKTELITLLEYFRGNFLKTKKSAETYFAIFR